MPCAAAKRLQPFTCVQKVCGYTILQCPQIVYTDLNGLFCETYLAVQVPGVAAQRMTSVAWKRTAGGMVRPSAWAVFRLMTSSKVVGCSTGKSAGLAPFRILST
jgi:hypothetical protein